MPAVAVLAASPLQAQRAAPAILILWAAIAVGWALIIPGALRRSADRQVRRLYREGKNRGILGPHEFEVSDAMLVERTPVGETRTVLAAVERVASDGTHTFIYLSALTAYVIPHGAVTEGDVDAFIAVVERGVLGQLPE